MLFTRQCTYTYTILNNCLHLDRHPFIFYLEVVGYLPCVFATSNIKATTGNDPLIVQAGYIHLPQEGGNNYKLSISYSMQGNIDCKGERVCTSVTAK